MKMKLILAIMPVLLSSSVWAADRLVPMNKVELKTPIRVMERADESVLLVKMSYSNGRWQAKPVSVLPCGGPSKINSVSPTRSMFQLKSRDGKTLYRGHIEDPRIILVEDPKKDPPLLKKTSFTLRIPLRSSGKTVVREKDIYNFEFFEQERKSEKPTVRLNLSKAMPQLSKMRSSKRISCQLVKPRMDKLPELKPGPDTGISTDSLATMIAKDKGMLVNWGIDNRVTPDQLKKLVMSHKEQWTRLQLNQRSVEALLEEYNTAYRKR